MTRTYTPKPNEIQRDWVVIDATDVVLGRLASHSAALLRGKHKPIFANHVDTGDFVIIVNADKVALTGQKLEQKKAYRHSGMLPKNSLGRQQLKKLKVYAGPEHPHSAQQPKPYTLTQVAQ
ncbi:MAG: ribosomal protein [Agromyces sp.]|nr:ribosomal protein [Agromyces sp.]